MKKIKITEAQDKAIKNIISQRVNESSQLDVNAGTNTGENGVPAQGGTVKIDYTPNTKMNPQQQITAASKAQETNKLGGKTVPVETEMPVGNEMKSIEVKESILITKKQLTEAKLKRLKANSKVIKVKDLFK